VSHGGGATRSDARANRKKLLDAAGELIAERGVDVPMHDIADHARVGIGTLYRNFTDRDELFLALGDRAAQRFKDISAAAAQAPTAWDAIMVYVDGYIALYEEFPWMVDMRVQDRRLRPRDDEDVATALAVVAAAHAEGTLRPDANMADIAFASTMLAGMTYLPQPVRGVVVPRLRDIVLDGLRSADRERSEIGVDPLTVDALKAFVRPIPPDAAS